MTASSLDREKKLLEYLQAHGRATIQELVEAFGVSNMTIHRDLKKLEEAGHIQKRHGGAVLAEPPHPLGGYACAMCGKPSAERTIFLVKFENGEEKRACCAHCGLMIQSRAETAWQSLTADFLHGHMVSANQAFYLLGSEIRVCCVPSVLSFASRQDAGKFQMGFGGTLAGMEEALAHLKSMMHAPK